MNFELKPSIGRAVEMEDLAKVLKALRDKPASLQAAVALLEKEAPSVSGGEVDEHGEAM